MSQPLNTPNTHTSTETGTNRSLALLTEHVGRVGGDVSDVTVGPWFDRSVHCRRAETDRGIAAIASHVREANAGSCRRKEKKRIEKSVYC